MSQSHDETAAPVVRGGLRIGAKDAAYSAPFAFADSHAHLADPAFDADRDLVVTRARQAGCALVVAIGESLAAAARAADIVRARPDFVAWTAGVHPHDAAGFDAARDVAAIDEQLAAGACAVGECGLDYHYDHSPRERQRTAFAAQLELAGARDRAVVVHTREAEEDTRAMVVEAGRAGVRGVLHCYTGSHALADAALEVGWMISFSGIVTFRKWDDDALIRSVPLERLLVESDAPWLAPLPNRGRRNEPAWVAHTIARVAAARGASAADIAAATLANTRLLFGVAATRVG